MRRSVVVSRGDPIKPSFKCPFCGVVSTFTPIKWTLDHWISQCDACQKTFYSRVNHLGSIGDRPRFEVLETYPKHLEEKHESIPENIWDDFSQAQLCLGAPSFKGTVILCRRTMQNISLTKGATKKDTSGNWIPLRNQIKTAFPGAQYELLREMADEIKYFGDYGAHPQDDGVDKVKEEDAKEILEFIRIFLEITYIIPYNIEQLSKKRKTT